MKGEHSIELLCELLRVSRSGYYRWKQGRRSARRNRDAELVPLVIKAHQRGRKAYGAPRIVRELRDEGVRISKRRCARLMRDQGIRGKKNQRRRPRTTDSKHAHAPAPNLLANARPPTGPNQIWGTDITYIRTGEGWLYLAAILDLWSRRVIGWACSPTLHVDLVLAALDQARRQRRPPRGLLHHSDRGVQYACDAYRKTLRTAGLIASMSRKGNCYDNASVESFWSTLKTETDLDAVEPINRHAAELIIFDYIETFYNPTRRHSSLGYLSPVAFEKQPTKKDEKAA
jgi:putative transposase